MNLDDYIGPFLGKTVKKIENHLQKTFEHEKLDLTKEQVIILKNLYNKDGINQNELAALTLRDKSSLTRLLTKMETKNYVFRKKCNDDKRSKNVFITPLGKSVFEKGIPSSKKVLSQVEENISAKEKQQIITILEKIQNNVCSEKNKTTN